MDGRDHDDAEDDAVDTADVAREVDMLDALLADAADAEVARDRVRTRSLREAAAQEASIAGALEDLLERAVVVTVRTTSARTYRGRVGALGRDVAALTTDSGLTVLVPFGAIAWVRANDGRRHAEVASRRPRPGVPAPSFAAVLGDMAPDRREVQVGVAGEALVTGRLQAVGVDVAMLRLSVPDQSTLVIPLASVTEVVLLDRVDRLG